MTVLSKQVDSINPSSVEKSKSGFPKGILLGLGVFGLMIWKLKFLAILILTKAKLLLLGLTKVSTLFSMFLSFGVYWKIWGWKFALGLIASIYVHEMGHIAALRRYGIKATPPMFIPGFGALIRTKQYPTNAREDARVGLAGPIWGLGAAVVAYAIFLGTDWGSFAAIAHIGAWINLFNLTPIWQLDGHHAFRALSKQHRWVAFSAVGISWILTHEGLLVLLLIFAGYQAFQKDAPSESDLGGLIQYIALVAVLSVMCLIRAPSI